MSLNPEHLAHLGAGAVLTVAGAAAAAVALHHGDRSRAAGAAGAAGLGWLSMRYAALSARTRRVEVACGAWRHLAPDWDTRGQLAAPATPSPVAGADGHNPECTCRRPRLVTDDVPPPWWRWPDWPTGR